MSSSDDEEPLSESRSDIEYEEENLENDNEQTDSDIHLGIAMITESNILPENFPMQNSENESGDTQREQEPWESKSGRGRWENKFARIFVSHFIEVSLSNEVIFCF